MIRPANHVTHDRRLRAGFGKYRALDEAECLAGPGPEAVGAWLRARLERGRLHALAGDPAAARGCFLEVWELARVCGEDFQAMDAVWTTNGSRNNGELKLKARKAKE